MGDIGYIFFQGLDADVFLDGPDLGGLKDLETAVVISLFTDRRAEDDDPVDPTDRRGWWADTFPGVEGDKIGSRLWELEREKQTQQTLNRAHAYVQEALAWLVDDGVAESIEVETEWVKMGFLGIGVKIDRPEGQEDFRFEVPWNQIRDAA